MQGDVVKVIAPYHRDRLLSDLQKQNADGHDLQRNSADLIGFACKQIPKSNGCDDHNDHGGSKVCTWAGVQSCMISPRWKNINTILAKGKWKYYRGFPKIFLSFVG